MKKNIDTKTKLFENMKKLNSNFEIKEVINEEFGLETEANVFAGVNYKMKVDKIKAFLDNLLTTKEYDGIDSLFQLTVGRGKKFKFTTVNENLENNKK
jgi:hypothetical protein